MLLKNADAVPDRSNKKGQALRQRRYGNLYEYGIFEKAKALRQLISDRMWKKVWVFRASLGPTFDEAEKVYISEMQKLSKRIDEQLRIREIGRLEHFQVSRNRLTTRKIRQNKKLGPVP